MVEIKSIQTEKILYKGKKKLPTTNSQLPTASKACWYVYLVQCKDNSLYTGVTNNLQKRMLAHESGRGSKYVKAKGFRQLLRFKECENKIEAQKTEYKIKQFKSQSEKLNWFVQKSDE